MARPDWRELCSSSKAALWTVTTFPVVLEMFVLRPHVAHPGLTGCLWTANLGRSKYSRVNNTPVFVCKELEPYFYLNLIIARLGFFYSWSSFSLISSHDCSTFFWCGFTAFITRWPPAPASTLRARAKSQGRELEPQSIQGHYYWTIIRISHCANDTVGIISYSLLVHTRTNKLMHVYMAAR